MGCKSHTLVQWVLSVLCGGQESILLHLQDYRKDALDTVATSGAFSEVPFLDARQVPAAGLFGQRHASLEELRGAHKLFSDSTLWLFFGGFLHASLRPIRARGRSSRLRFVLELRAERERSDRPEVLVHPPLGGFCRK